MRVHLLLFAVIFIAVYDVFWKEGHTDGEKNGKMF